MTSALTYVLIAGILACVLAMFVVAARGNGPSLKELPVLDPAPVLDKKEAGLAADLETIAKKLGYEVLVKPPLSSVVQARDQKLRDTWNKALAIEYIDFVLTDQKNHKPVLAVLPSGEGRGDSRHPVAARALDGAGIPYIAVGNYNIAGLEKALRERLGDTGGSGRRTRKRAQQPPEDPPFQEGAPEASDDTEAS